MRERKKKSCYEYTIFTVPFLPHSCCCCWSGFLFVFFVCNLHIHGPTIYCSWVVPLWSKELFFSNKCYFVRQSVGYSDVYSAIFTSLVLLLLIRVFFFVSLFVTYIHKPSYCSWVVLLLNEAKNFFFESFLYASLPDILSNSTNHRRATVWIM